MAKIPKLAAPALLLIAAASSSRAQPPASRAVPGPGASTSPTAPAPSAPPLQNIHRLSAQLLSGSEPHDDAAFSKLAELGVRTVVSVDGIKPDVAAAKKHGLRYIHIPIGYDGVDAPTQAALTRLVHEVKGPIYIHCHHGKHRGPAAAAVACMAAGDMNQKQALDFLKLAGTGKEYAGLWRDVGKFTPLPTGARLPPLIETAKVDSLAAAMAQLDRAWDGVKACQAADWKTPNDHADLAPAHQSLMVLEGLKEARRTLEHPDPQLARWLEEAAINAEQLHQSLQAGRPDPATRAFRQLEAACTRCHEQYRN